MTFEYSELSEVKGQLWETEDKLDELQSKFKREQRIVDALLNQIESKG